MKEKNLYSILILILISLVFVSCAPGGGSSSVDDPGGFFMGVWHGWIAPITLIWGLFDSSIRVYEVYNTGWWYDFGFYIAIVGGFGSFAFFRKSSENKR